MRLRSQIITTLSTIVVAAGAVAVYLHGKNVAILNPQGPIAHQERGLIIFGSLLALIVVVPVFAMLFAFAWKYREDNTSARYTPDWDGNRAAEITWWSIPILLIGVLSVVAWASSHSLDPYKPLASNKPAITVQVIALDWKWLFIYPVQNIATVNYIQFPVGTPVNFEITSDAPMNSFWIPQLAGQIYAMPGMSTQLHLMADHAGSYAGSSANISGQGFAGMKFVAKATSQASFDQWVKTVKKSSNVLTINEYNNLAQPSQNNPVAYYASSSNSLYEEVVMRYMAPGLEEVQ